MWRSDSLKRPTSSSKKGTHRKGKMKRRGRGVRLSMSSCGLHYNGRKGRRRIKKWWKKREREEATEDNTEADEEKDKKEDVEEEKEDRRVLALKTGRQLYVWV